MLDAHLSPGRVGEALASRGHDVLCLASESSLGTLPDGLVLELAAEQRRILVTRNSRDFAPLVREWAEAMRHHSGCILIWTIAHHQFSAIVEGVSGLLEARPDAATWDDLTLAI